ncbi:helix-turn-helix domain-containing protein [Georgenia thermotolerans]|uniref:Helix-turn-helix domain-containing protein n=2 Tax=Georgenia thermotolerans TaxID=527326 RepID=A0A7J5UUI4_9MICO|nr:helix-turn-helix domain-containing protein [Georgenia thermotolerans]
MILDELSHKPLGLAELADRVRLSKSSVSDICSTLVGTDLIRRSTDGTYRLGGHLSTLARQTSPAPSVVDGFIRASLEGTPLDGHTLSVSTMVGCEVVTLNVRLGRHPLPLTPRPGTRTPLLQCAAGPAIAASLGEGLDAELELFAAHQGLDGDGRSAIHAVVERMRRSEVSTWRSKNGIHQLARAVGRPEEHMLTAITLHLPYDPLFKLDVAALAGALAQFAHRLG